MYALLICDVLLQVVWTNAHTVRRSMHVVNLVAMLLLILSTELDSHFKVFTLFLPLSSLFC